MRLEKSRRYLPLLLLALLLLAFAMPGLFGQALNFGTFLGSVRDPSGAGIPNAKIVLTRSETGAVKEATTDNEGNYRLPEVSAGMYRFEFEHAGFRKVVRDRIALSAGQSLRVDGDLTLGSVSDSVVVDARVAEVDTNTANVGSTVFGSQVTELALNTRSAHDVAARGGLEPSPAARIRLQYLGALLV